MGKMFSRTRTGSRTTRSLTSSPGGKLPIASPKAAAKRKSLQGPTKPASPKSSTPQPRSKVPSPEPKGRKARDLKSPQPRGRSVQRKSIASSVDTSSQSEEETAESDNESVVKAADRSKSSPKSVRGRGQSALKRAGASSNNTDKEREPTPTSKVADQKTTPSVPSARGRQTQKKATATSVRSSKSDEKSDESEPTPTASRKASPAARSRGRPPKTKLIADTVSSKDDSTVDVDCADGVSRKTSPSPDRKTGKRGRSAVKTSPRPVRGDTETSRVTSGGSRARIQTPTIPGRKPVTSAESDEESGKEGESKSKESDSASSLKSPRGRRRKKEIEPQQQANSTEDSSVEVAKSEVSESRSVRTPRGQGGKKVAEGNARSRSVTGARESSAESTKEEIAKSKATESRSVRTPRGTNKVAEGKARSPSVTRANESSADSTTEEIAKSKASESRNVRTPRGGNKVAEGKAGSPSVTCARESSADSTEAIKGKSGQKRKSTSGSPRMLRRIKSAKEEETVKEGTAESSTESEDHSFDKESVKGKTRKSLGVKSVGKLPAKESKKLGKAYGDQTEFVKESPTIEVKSQGKNKARSLSPKGKVESPKVTGRRPRQQQPSVQEVNKQLDSAEPGTAKKRGRPRKVTTDAGKEVKSLKVVEKTSEVDEDGSVETDNEDSCVEPKAETSSDQVKGRRGRGKKKVVSSVLRSKKPKILQAKVLAAKARQLKRAATRSLRSKVEETHSDSEEDELLAEPSVFQKLTDTAPKKSNQVEVGSVEDLQKPAKRNISDGSRKGSVLSGQVEKRKKGKPVVVRKSFSVARELKALSADPGSKVGNVRGRRLGAPPRRVEIVKPKRRITGKSKQDNSESQTEVSDATHLGSDTGSVTSSATLLTRAQSPASDSDAGDSKAQRRRLSPAARLRCPFLATRKKRSRSPNTYYSARGTSGKFQKTQASVGSSVSSETEVEEKVSESESQKSELKSPAPRRISRSQTDKRRKLSTHPPEGKADLKDLKPTESESECVSVDEKEVSLRKSSSKTDAQASSSVKTLPGVSKFSARSKPTTTAVTGEEEAALKKLSPATESMVKKSFSIKTIEKFRKAFKLVDPALKSGASSRASRDTSSVSSVDSDVALASLIKHKGTGLEKRGEQKTEKGADVIEPVSSDKVLESLKSGKEAEGKMVGVDHKPLSSYEDIGKAAPVDLKDSDHGVSAGHIEVSAVKDRLDAGVEPKGNKTMESGMKSLSEEPKDIEMEEMTEKTADAKSLLEEPKSVEKEGVAETEKTSDISQPGKENVQAVEGKQASEESVEVEEMAPDSKVSDELENKQKDLQKVDALIAEPQQSLKKLEATSEGKEIGSAVGEIAEKVDDEQTDAKVEEEKSGGATDMESDSPNLNQADQGSNDAMSEDAIVEYAIATAVEETIQAIMSIVEQTVGDSKKSEGDEESDTEEATSVDDAVSSSEIKAAVLDTNVAEMPEDKIAEDDMNVAAMPEDKIAEDDTNVAAMPEDKVAEDKTPKVPKETNVSLDKEPIKSDIEPVTEVSPDADVPLQKDLVEAGTAPASSAPAEETEAPQVGRDADQTSAAADKDGPPEKRHSDIVSEQRGTGKLEEHLEKKTETTPQVTKEDEVVDKKDGLTSTSEKTEVESPVKESITGEEKVESEKKKTDDGKFEVESPPQEIEKSTDKSAADAEPIREFASVTEPCKHDFSAVSSKEESTSATEPCKESALSTEPSKEESASVTEPSKQESAPGSCTEEESMSGNEPGKAFVSDTEPSKESDAGAEPGKQESVPDAEPRKQESVSGAEPGKQEYVSGAEPGKQESVPDAETGKQASVSDAETGKQESVSGADSGKQESVSCAEPGKQASVSDAEPGKQASVSDAETGKQESVSGAEPGRQGSVSGAEPGKQEYVSDAKPGKEESVSAGAEPGKQEAVSVAEPRKQEFASGAEPSKEQTASVAESSKGPIILKIKTSDLWKSDGEGSAASTTGSVENEETLDDIPVNDSVVVSSTSNICPMSQKVKDALNNVNRTLANVSSKDPVEGRDVPAALGAPKSDTASVGDELNAKANEEAAVTSTEEEAVVSSSKEDESPAMPAESTKEDGVSCSCHPSGEKEKSIQPGPSAAGDARPPEAAVEGDQQQHSPSPKVATASMSDVERRIEEIQAMVSDIQRQIKTGSNTGAGKLAEHRPGLHGLDDDLGYQHSQIIHHSGEEGDLKLTIRLGGKKPDASKGLFDAASPGTSGTGHKTHPRRTASPKYSDMPWVEYSDSYLEDMERKHKKALAKLEKTQEEPSTSVSEGRSKRRPVRKTEYELYMYELKNSKRRKIKSAMSTISSTSPTESLVNEAIEEELKESNIPTLMKKCTPCNVVLVDFVTRLNLSALKKRRAEELSPDGSPEKRPKLSLETESGGAEIDTETIVKQLMPEKKRHSSGPSRRSSGSSSAGSLASDLESGRISPCSPRAINVPPNRLSPKPRKKAINRTGFPRQPRKYYYAYQCKFCPYSTNYRIAMDDHVYTHLDVVPFRCGYCNDIFGAKSGAVAHHKRNHQNLPLRCIKSVDVDESKYYDYVYVAGKGKSPASPKTVAAEGQKQRNVFESMMKEIPGKEQPASSAQPPASVQPQVVTAAQSIHLLPIAPSTNIQKSPVKPLQTQTSQVIQKSPQAPVSQSAAVTVKPAQVKPQTQIAPKASRMEKLPVYQCKFCDFSTDHRNIIEAHLQQLHEEEYRFICPLCDLAFCKREETMVKHFKKWHPGRNVIFKRAPGVKTGQAASSSGAASMSYEAAAQKSLQPNLNDAQVSNREKTALGLGTKTPPGSLSAMAMAVPGSNTSQPQAILNIPAPMLRFQRQDSPQSSSPGADTARKSGKLSISDIADSLASKAGKQGVTLNVPSSGSQGGSGTAVASPAGSRFVRSSDNRGGILDLSFGNQDAAGSSDTGNLKIVNVVSLSAPQEKAKVTSDVTEDELATLFGCKTCKQEFDSFENAMKHIEMSHSQMDFWFACPYCPYGCSKHRGNMVRHIKRAHPLKASLQVDIHLIDEGRYISKRVIAKKSVKPAGVQARPTQVQMFGSGPNEPGAKVRVAPPLMQMVRPMVSTPQTIPPPLLRAVPITQSQSSKSTESSASTTVNPGTRSEQSTTSTFSSQPMQSTPQARGLSLQNPVGVPQGTPRPPADSRTTNPAPRVKQEAPSPTEQEKFSVFNLRPTNPSTVHTQTAGQVVSSQMQQQVGPIQFGHPGMIPSIRPEAVRYGTSHAIPSHPQAQIMFRPSHPPSSS